MICDVLILDRIYCSSRWISNASVSSKDIKCGNGYSHKSLVGTLYISDSYIRYSRFTTLEMSTSNK